MVLEVIVGNDVAIRAYEKKDYQINRLLDCFGGAIEMVEKAPAAVIRKLEEFEWDKFTSFWTMEPSWQNAVITLENSKNRCSIIGAYLDEELIGYMVYNAALRRIQQIAVSTKHRRKGVATQLVNSMIASIDPKELFIYNVDHDSLETSEFLKSFGLQIHLSQLEMKRAL